MAYRSGDDSAPPRRPAGRVPDFVDLTIALLGLTADRRELAEATRWVEPPDRILLALWWLEASGQLTRPELVTAVEQPPERVAARIGQLRALLGVARRIVRALAARPRCPELTRIGRTWDGATTALWRRRFARHLRGCPYCAVPGAVLADPDQVLRGLPLLTPAPGG